MHWLYLAGAILTETAATSALKSSAGFTHLGWTLFSLAGYGVAFYLLSLTLESLALGVAYAVWAGVGTALIALIGVVLHNQTLDLGAALGIGLIVAGVVVLNVFSKASVP